MLRCLWEQASLDGMLESIVCCCRAPASNPEPFPYAVVPWSSGPAWSGMVRSFFSIRRIYFRKFSLQFVEIAITATWIVSSPKRDLTKKDKSGSFPTWPLSKLRCQAQVSDQITTERKIEKFLSFVCCCCCFLKFCQKRVTRKFSCMFGEWPESAVTIPCIFE